MCELIVVDQTQIKDTSYPNKLTTGGLGPCIAIGIYDKVLRHGYMMHESNAHINRQVANFISRVLEVSSVENLEVFITGGALNLAQRLTSRENKYTLAARQYVLGEIKGIFNPNQLQINWNHSDEFIELTLDTKNGEFTIID